MSSMQPVRLILFDLDGTLIDSKQDIATSVNSMMGLLNLPPLPHETIYEFVGNGVTPLIRQAVATAGGMDFDRALEIFKAYYMEHCLDTTTLFPGVLEVFRHLAGIPKVVLTNKSQGFSEKILQGLGLTPLLKGIYGGDTEFPKKPDPAVVHHLMKIHKAGASETIMVGDSSVDMETGRRAGILTAGVTYGLRPREEILGCRPDLILESITDLLKLSCQ